MDAGIKAWRELSGTAAWFRSSPPEPPATDAGIAAAEARLGRTLPPLLAAMLRQSRAWSWRGEDEDVVWMPPEDLALGARAGEQGLEWDIDDAGPGVEPVYDSPDRLTFAYSDARVFQIDFAPAEDGVVGQVVAYDPEMGCVDLVAGSLEAFLAEGLRCLREVEVEPEPAPAPEKLVATAAAGVPAEIQRRNDLMAALDAAAKDPAALRELLVSIRDSAPADADEEEEEDEDPPLEPLPLDPAYADATGRAAAAFAAAVALAAPELRKRLKAPLSASKARALLAKERKAGVVPDTLLPLFASFDGQKGSAPLLPCPAGLSSGLGWLPLLDVGYRYNSEIGPCLFTGDMVFPPVPGVRDVRWHPRWVPLLANSLNDSRDAQVVVFADFAPAEGGHAGQLVMKVMRYTLGVGYHGAERRVLAPSLPAWLEGLAADIGAGRLVVHKQGFRAA